VPVSVIRGRPSAPTADTVDNRLAGVVVDMPASGNAVTHRRRLLRAAMGALAVGALGSLMRSMVEAVTSDGAGSSTRGTTTDRGRRDTMTEHPKNDERSGGEEDDSAAEVVEDTGRLGRVRTEGETAVDDALGQGPLPDK